MSRQWLWTVILFFALCVGALIIYPVLIHDSAQGQAARPFASSDAIFPRSDSMVDAPSPTVVNVSPSEGYSRDGTMITITAASFTATPTVTLGLMVLRDVGFVSSSVLTATVPADLPGGVYTITVTNPDGQSASLANAFTVLLAGDGALGMWKPSTSMLELRAYFAAVEAEGHIYSLGGWDKATSEMASIENDGSLSSWQPVAPLNMARYEPAAATNGHYLYVVGGSSTAGSGPFNTVERAVINSDGSLSAWEYVNPMIEKRTGLAAVVVGNYVYALGGPYSASVERARINADGSLGTWEYVSSMTTARYGHTGIVIGRYLYAFGGSSFDVPTSSVERAEVRDDGTLGAWKVIGTMKRPRQDFATVTRAGYVYVMGGRENLWASAMNSVERAALRPDGTLGPWAVVWSMDSPRQFLAAVVAGDYIYSMGGQDADYQPLSSVERAEIGKGILPTELGLSINDGALFTNKVTVTLTIGAEPETRQMEVSNDGGFSGASWEPYASDRTWQITQYGNYVIPRVVYVRYKDLDGNPSATFQDDIILDVTAPTGTVDAVPDLLNSAQAPVDPTASAGRQAVMGVTDNLTRTIFLPMILRGFVCPPTGPVNVTLYVSAQDDVSGVADMMISNSEGFPCASWEPYATTRQWHVPHGTTTTVYAKFRDNAGNVSEVATDTVAIR